MYVHVTISDDDAIVVNYVVFRDSKTEFVDLRNEHFVISTVERMLVWITYY